MIACGHCGGRHASVAEVRRCALDHPRPDEASFDEASFEEVQSFEGPPARTRAAVQSFLPSPPRGALPPLPGPASTWAGPEALGRSLVVEPGGVAPPPWADAPVVRVDPARTMPDTLDALRAAWHQRTRLVIELAGPLEDPDIVDQPWWELGPDLVLTSDELIHLVTANSVVVRTDGDVDCRPVQLAIAAGAGPTASADTDVELPDGAPALADGGPLAFPETLLGSAAPAIVPRVHLESQLLRPLGHSTPDAELAPDQLAAVRHSGGAARIIAPAGSGKTRVLTERVRHLVRDRGIDPSAICLLAFNVRAREEMQDRTGDLPGLEIRTLNSLALAIVNGAEPFAPLNGRRRTTIDERDVRNLLRRLVKTRRQAMADPLAAWIEALGASRLGLRPPSVVEEEFDGDVKGFADIAPQYREALERQGWLDFDEQILAAIEILLRDPDARARAQACCRVLLVDEFQDLTPAHVLLVRLLAGPAADVFGVGDDDQTIYGYAGADPAWLIDFGQLFPGAAAHPLTVNYRCPPEVVEAAANLLGWNRRRVEKDIHPAPGRPAGDALVRVNPGTDALAALTARVTSLLASGVEPSDIAVLTRVNSSLLGPMAALTEAGVPCQRPLDRNFLTRTGVAGALAWLAVATASDDRLPTGSMGDAARRPPRGISPRLVEWIDEKSSLPELVALGQRLREPRDTAKLEAFVADIHHVKDRSSDGATTLELLTTIGEDLGLARALEERLDASRRSVDRSAHGDDINALRRAATLHPDPRTFPRWLSDNLDQRPDPGGVRLATVHKVKGREWPHVVVFDIDAGLFPHRLAADLEEERRVFHVAITRGSESVTLIPGDTPSPFLDQMTETAPPRNAGGDHAGRSRPSSKSATRERERTEPPPAGSDHIEARRARLRAFRTERAVADKVPAFVVFSDDTLHRLADAYPTTDEQLLAIKGIGPAKLERYGEGIFAALAGATTDLDP